jgi:leader peptidase (prepilin peptidase) / N-methyltransferase
VSGGATALTAVLCGTAGLLAMVWFPAAASALATRSVVPRLPPAASALAAIGRHPARSLAWALLPATVMIRFGPQPVDGAVVLGVMGCAVLSAMVDVRCHRLPDAITAPLWAVAWPVMAAVAVIGGNPTRIRLALVAALVAVVVLGVGWLVGMGLGDVKLGAVLALVAGWLAADPAAAVGAALAMVALASVAAVVHAMAGMAAGRLRRQWFAFGPHLVAAATVVVMVAGPASMG